MSFKDHILSSFIALENEVETNNYVHKLRGEALKDFENLGIPQRKEEAYKYTSLKSLFNKDYSLFPKKETSIDYGDIKKYLIHQIDAYRIIFIDGIYSSHLSQTTHDKFDVCLMSSALNNPKYASVIENYYNKLATKDGLTSLNAAFAKEGAYIHIGKNIAVEKPIEIVYFSTGNEAEMMTQPRNLVVVGENSQVQVIERHQSLSDNAVLTNCVTEIYAAKRALVDWYKIQNDKLSASLIDHTFAEQKDNSEVRIHTFSFGGKITRNNLSFYQRGEHCNSVLNGVTIIEGKQHVDHSTLVHHTAPNCESFQEYKQIFDERAVGVFNGKVLVDKIAQKINAYQQNNNILVSDTSTINAKPQLEIFADDVRCSHGCTIGQLDDEALFYMQARGIPKKEARALLMFAFANSVLETVKIPEIKSRITKLIATKLGVEIGFDL
ncbi:MULTISPECIES: Fe-S cluster assembly protein SufD [Nonlabens]|uniref:Iron-regulated ABC transporter permease protein SufD n=1 Tax=Nonlabens xylanidelens TaxID=191564 RepID=A0A2S6IQR6_9FLAO|nr:Fe-S cluster assembly protein SufD [Nonlabens xylanidelens]PPK96589.1 iron-regulated ABC transporter permease protein SufD [Nonlabens xylanidelens]PQJ13309.1 Fe-S cluster assembly protein SufD [Nonlabens xylanidelens]